MTVAKRVRVTGVVQGVGFRPFVWRLAREMELSGWVRNDAAGVAAEVEGAPERVAAFLAALKERAPPLARVDAVTAAATATQGRAGFAILESAGGRASTAIGHDTAVCADCLAEMFDPAGRRWRHAFITCTHCGPRYTVSRGLPYDRARTSLAPFPLCPDCAREYGEPADRRFHAETTCCPDCGPQLSLVDANGMASAGDPIAGALAMLRAGRIVAIKGLGGFHLAVDARNAAAVAALRARKHREAKPFALMAANAASLAGLAAASGEELALLQSAERPIVLLAAAGPAPAGIAPGLDRLGLMLPYTPLQYLLFHEAAGRPAGTAWLEEAQDLLLVMTSANPHDEPLVIGNDEARARLAGIADAWLLHDRDIVVRCDDSVAWVPEAGRGPQLIRRARGYTPRAIRLPRSGPSVLAFGAWFKNTVCVTRGDEAFVSQHVGDLENAAACGFLAETVAHLLDILEVAPAAVAHDLHPDFASTRAAIAFAAERGLPCLPVQHHHAHIAAVCAERGVEAPVLGLALDGVGLGADGAAWGGELLRVDGGRCERLGHLKPLALPGGDRAAREPWRMAAAALHDLGRGGEIERRFAGEAGAATVAAMLAKGVNSPRSSSMGRVFDAAAGLLGISRRLDYEAQAAILLEQAAARHIERHGWPRAAGAWRIDAAGELDLLPLLAILVDAEEAGAAAAHFHGVVVEALAAWVTRAREETGLATVVLGGGCFLNRLLVKGLRQRLEAGKVEVLAPARLSPGDMAVSLGQAWVALCGQQ